MRRIGVSGPWALALWMVTVIARAQTEDPAAARVLFEEGRTLVKEGDYQAACPAFERARQLLSSAGILINLADCYERTGRTASAWLTFGEAEAVATRTQRPDHAAEAERRRRLLEPSLRRVAILAPHPVDGLVVKRDGVVVTPAAWGVAVPVDEGAHEIRAEAAGHQTWTFSLLAPLPGRKATVEIPELALSPTALPSAAALTPSSAAAPSPASPSADDARVRGSAARAWGWGFLLGGAAATVVGSVLLVAESDRSQRANEARDPAAWDDAASLWRVGLAAAIGGGAFAVGGALWLVVTDRGVPARGLHVSPILGRSVQGIELERSF